MKETSKDLATKDSGAEKIAVKLKDNKTYLDEIGQPTGIEYAFLSENNEQCHVWVKCRDFLNDALRSYFIGRPEQIYRFAYDPKVDPKLDINRMRMLVSFCSTPSCDRAQVVDSALAMIHCLEKHGGISPLSKIFPVEGKDAIFIFEGSSDWMESTFMISLYTFIIRLGAKRIFPKDANDFEDKLKELCLKNSRSHDHDFKYLNTVKSYILRIIEERKNLRYKREDGTFLFNNKDVHTFHGYTGIVSLCRKSYSGVEELKPLGEYIMKK